MSAWEKQKDSTFSSPSNMFLSRGENNKNTTKYNKNTTKYNKIQTYSQNPIPGSWKYFSVTLSWWFNYHPFRDWLWLMGAERCEMWICVTSFSRTQPVFIFQSHRTHRIEQLTCQRVPKHSLKTLFSCPPETWCWNRHPTRGTPQKGQNEKQTEF